MVRVHIFPKYIQQEHLYYIHTYVRVCTYIIIYTCIYVCVCTITCKGNMCTIQFVKAVIVLEVLFWMLCEKIACRCMLFLMYVTFNVQVDSYLWEFLVF